MHHRVSLTKTPWFRDNGLPLHKVHDAIRALHRLPAETQVSYGNWIVYLTDMVLYLNSIMYCKEDTYPLVRSSLTEDPIHLTAYDAAVFVFPWKTSGFILRRRSSLFWYGRQISPIQTSIQETYTNNVLRLGQCFYT